MRYTECFKAFLPCILMSWAPVQAGEFTDDLGRTFNFKETDKFASRAATGALSLYRMGIEDQITSIWGLWGIRGTDLDIDNPGDGSRYPDADPFEEEVVWLHTKNNLSPGCFTNPRGCFRWDDISFIEKYKDEIDYILFIDNGVDSQMRTVTEETGIPVVFIDTFFEYHPDCRYVNDEENADYDYKDQTKCFGRSMIDIASRIEELAIAIGGANIEQIEQDKKNMCKSAQKFTDTMQKKQEEGIRVAAAINAIRKDEDTGEDIFAVVGFDPITLWVPRTLEELGMPIVHHNSSDGGKDVITGPDFFPECEKGVLSESCNDNPLIPVDFWIYDSRSYLNILDNEDVVKLIFPDKAMLAGQHWHYARNDGPLSYNAIHRMLEEMTKRMSKAKRMHPKTPCTPADPKSALTAKFGGGLGRNEYICYNEDLIQSEYLSGCSAGSTLSNGAIAGIVIGSLAVVGIGVFMFFSLRSSKK